MNKSKGGFSIIIGWCTLITSSYLGIASFTYLLKTFKSKRRNENIIVFLCSVFSIPFSVLYFLLVLHYENDGTLLSNSLLCKVYIKTFETTVVINKCLCNAIFALRYKTLNKTISWLNFSKRVLGFSVATIVISAFQLVFLHIYTLFVSVYTLKTCLHFKIDSEKHLIYILAVLGCLFITTILQTVILIETVKPICNHSNNLSNSNNRLRNILKRIIISTLLFAISDFGLVVVQFVMIKVIGRPLSILTLINMNLNCFSLIYSYGDCKQRLFPFLTSTTTQSNLNGNEFVTRKEPESIETRRKLKTNRSKNEELIELKPIHDEKQNIMNDLSYILR